jgi:predicted solute-binding protein
LSSAVAKLVVQEKLVNMSDQMFYGTLGIGMIPIFFYINKCLEYCLQDVMISQ